MVFLIGMPNLGEMIFLVVIILLLFGGKKLPELARGLGAGIHEFRRGMNGQNEPTETRVHDVERDVTPQAEEAAVSQKQITAPRAKAKPAAKKQTQSAKPVAKKASAKKK
ncbi:MAG: Sec-independent protein translocase protein TatA [Turneriella sp.]|nr:Sec-independent protein translocase protein TatA [Turneriella sp.]